MLELVTTSQFKKRPEAASKTRHEPQEPLQRVEFSLPRR